MIGKSVLGLLALGTLLAGVQARADLMPGSAFKVAGWDGSARSQQSGGFAYCLVRRDYPNGIQLTVARAPEGLFFLGFQKSDWQLQKDAPVRARLALDDAAGHVETGNAVSTNTLLFTFGPPDGAVYSALIARAGRLSMADLAADDKPASDTTWQFDLAGIHEAIDALAGCIDRRGAAEPAALRN